jgi:Domain of unknown function (DUF4158)
MARRRLLTDELWARHFQPPEDEREIARHYTLGPDEMEQITAKRGDANRLGYALVLLYLRHPGRALDSGERPPAKVLAYAARQLGIGVGAFDDYARRDATRRSHLAEAMRRGGYAGFDRTAARAAVDFLTASAQIAVRPGQLAGILIDELRRRRILLPSPLILEAVIRGAKQRAERVAHKVLTAGLDRDTIGRLEALLDQVQPASSPGLDGSETRRGHPHRRTCPNLSSGFVMCVRSESTARGQLLCRLRSSSGSPTRRCA